MHDGAVKSSRVMPGFSRFIKYVGADGSAPRGKSGLPASGSSTSSNSASMSVELIGLPPILVVLRWGLILAPDQAVFHHQQVHLRAHEAAVSVLRRADD